MHAAPGGASLALRPRLHVLDRALLLMAVASVVVFLADRAFELARLEARALLAVDLALVALYALIFAAKAATAPRPLVWLRTHAWLVPALVPLTLPLLAEPWFLLVQVLVIVLRAGKALDRAFGAHVLEGLSERYAAMIVERATEPLLMRLAEALEESVTSRDYAAAVGRRLEARRELVEEAVHRALESRPRLGRLAALPPVRRIVDEATKEVVDAAHAALTGPELNTIIRESLRDACRELKAGIAEPKWTHKGVGISDVLHGVVRRAPAPAPVLDVKA